MADPARFDIDVWFDAERKAHSLFIERSVCGKWIKADDFDDYKAGRRRNSTEESVTQMGIEIAELRCRIAELEGRSK